MRHRRNVKNAFRPDELSEITGIQPAMINFLIRQGYLQPSYREDYDLPTRSKRQPRGNTRYFSYRDLLIAKTIQRLVDAGVQLVRVKEALKELREDKHWLATTRGVTVERVISWLVTDGKDIYLRDDTGFLEVLRKGHQRAFSFVIEMKSIRSAVCHGIESSRFPECRKKISYFKLANDAPIFDPPRRSAARASQLRRK